MPEVCNDCCHSAVSSDGSIPLNRRRNAVGVNAYWLFRETTATTAISSVEVRTMCRMSAPDAGSFAWR